MEIDEIDNPAFVMDHTAVTAICWMPRNVCRPKKFGPDENTPPEDEPVNNELTVEEQKTAEEFHMDDYDDEDESGGMQFFQVLQSDLTTKKDKNITGNPDSDSESEDYHEVRPTDNLFIAVSCEEEACTLEVFLYDMDDCSMYVHHDIILPAYPLCVEWFNGLPPTHAEGVGNFAAVGGFNSSIDIWDLDDLEAIEPLFSVGGKKKAHKGGVMCMHSSPNKRTVLASGGADHIVALWDLRNPEKAVHRYDFHKDKVQCTKWHPTEQAILLTAAYDRTMAFLDVRKEDAPQQITLPADAESAAWGSLRAAECYVSCDDGSVLCYDARKLGSTVTPLWTLNAHKKACTSVQQPRIKDMLVTAGVNGKAKIWNISTPTPTLVYSKELNAGAIFSCSVNDDVPNLLAFGAESAVLWDITEDANIVQAFGLQTSS